MFSWTYRERNGENYGGLNMRGISYRQKSDVMLTGLVTSGVGTAILNMLFKE